MRAGLEGIVEEVAGVLGEEYVRWRVGQWKLQSRRIREGLARARALGARLGRPLSYDASATGLLGDLSRSGSQVAQQLGVSKSTVTAWRRRHRQGGDAF